MPLNLLTLGYEKREIDEYVELLVEAGVTTLVDVRETAWSHKLGFSKTALRAALATAGISYEHASFAGNPKRLRDAATSHAAVLRAFRRHLDANPSVLLELEVLLAGIFAADGVPCLMCYERHADDCHRAALAEGWRARAPRRNSRIVEHLATEGCRRLVTA